MATERKQVEFVYAGAIMHNDVVMHSYIEHSKGVLGNANLYAEPLSSHCPGSILTFTTPKDGSVVKESVLFQGMWKGEGDEVLMWTAMTDALLASEAAYAKYRGNPLLESLEPLRDVYAGMEARERAIFIAAVSAYIAGED
jgi:hypothetical protein